MRFLLRAAFFTGGFYLLLTSILFINSGPSLRRLENPILPSHSELAVNEPWIYGVTGGHSLVRVYRIGHGHIKNVRLPVGGGGLAIPSIGHDGNLYVRILRRNVYAVFSPEGEPIRRIWQRDDPDEFDKISGILRYPRVPKDKQGRVYEVECGKITRTSPGGVEEVLFDPGRCSSWPFRGMAGIALSLVILNAALVGPIEFLGHLLTVAARRVELLVARDR